MLATALLLALVAGPSASAAEPITPSGGSIGSTSEPAPESTTTQPSAAESSTTEATPIVEVTPPAVEITPPAVEVTPPVVDEAPVEVTPPAVEITPPAAEVIPPPAAPVVQTPEPASPPEVEAPVSELVPAEGTSKPVAEAGAESSQPIAATAGEAALSAASPSSGQIAAGLISPPAGASQNTAAADAPAVGASSVVLGGLAVESAGRSSRPPSGPGAGAVADRLPVVAVSAAQRAAELSCQLSGMAETVNDNCGAAWLGGEISLSVRAAGFRAPAGPRTGPPDEGYGDSVGGGHPVMPAPAPAPSGAVGGSAAGGSGVSPAGFFTLASLLLLAAPHALRRLRLLCRPWRTAFFVLIPERPG